MSTGVGAASVGALASLGVVVVFLNVAVHALPAPSAPSVDMCRSRGDMLVFHPSSGSCEQLLEPSAVCSSSEQVLVLDPTSLEASCSQVSTEELIAQRCPPGEEALLLPTGHFTCDCAVGHVFWPADDTCRELYARGPCDNGKLLEYNSSTGAVCRPSVCGEDEVMWKERCVPRYSAGCLAPGKGYLKVLVNLQLDCDTGCPEGLLLLERSCYKVHTQGPCRDGQHVSALGATSDGVCRVAAVCTSETPLVWQGRCYAAGQRCQHDDDTTTLPTPEDLQLAARELISLPKPPPPSGWGEDAASPPDRAQYFSHDGQLLTDSSLLIGRIADSASDSTVFTEPDRVDTTTDSQQDLPPLQPFPYTYDGRRVANPLLVVAREARGASPSSSIAGAGRRNKGILIKFNEQVSCRPWYSLYRCREGSRRQCRW